MRTQHHAVLALAVALVAATTPAPAVPEAATLFRDGDFAGAAAAYQATLDANPKDSTALTGLGAIRLYQNDLAAAEPLIRLAIAADPSNTRARVCSPNCNAVKPKARAVAPSTAPKQRCRSSSKIRCRSFTSSQTGSPRTSSSTPVAMSILNQISPNASA